MKKVLLTATLLLSTTSYLNARTVPSGSWPEIVSSSSGQMFDVTSVSGDGDCGFTAIHRSRAEVVSALQGAVEDNYAAYGRFRTARDSLHTAVEKLSSSSPIASVNAILDQVDSFIKSRASQYSTDLDARKPSVLASEALAEFRSGLRKFSAEQFISARRLLQSRIQNMYYERYEAFHEALKQELKESGKFAFQLNTKEGLKRSIEDVFAYNKGKTSWLPMGLIFGVLERLDLNLAVWSSLNEPSGKVKLYQFSAPDNNVWDPSVVHVRWNGGHFDTLSLKY